MSTSINKLFFIGTIKEITYHTDAKDAPYACLIVSRSNKNSDNNDFKVLVYKQNYINLIKNALNCSILIHGDVKQTLRIQEGQENEPNSIYEYKDNLYMQVVVAQQIILLNKTNDISEEDFKNQLNSFNIFLLLGNTGQDPEVKEIVDREDETKNLKLVTFSIATNRPYKTASLEKKESVTWHRVTIAANYTNSSLQGLANLVANYVKTGSKLFIIGSIQSKSFISRTGEKKVSLQMMLQNSAVTLSILQDSKRGNDRSRHEVEYDNENRYNNLNSKRKDSNYSNNSNSTLDQEYDEDQIPF